jgi:receptor-type tyrosine-protein phosphatase beta
MKSEVTLRYTATPSRTSLFDRYRFQLSDPSIPPKEKFANETDRKVTFDSLVPGRLYNFTIWTVSHDVTSRPLLRQDRLCKEIIENNENCFGIFPKDLSQILMNFQIQNL